MESNLKTSGRRFQVLPLCLSFSPLRSNSDQNKIVLYINTTCSNIQVMRMKELITKEKMC